MGKVVCVLCVFFNFWARSLILEFLKVYGYKYFVDEWGIFVFVHIISTSLEMDHALRSSYHQFYV